MACRRSRPNKTRPDKLSICCLLSSVRTLQGTRHMQNRLCGILQRSSNIPSQPALGSSSGSRFSHHRYTATRSPHAGRRSTRILLAQRRISAHDTAACRPQSRTQEPRNQCQSILAGSANTPKLQATPPQNTPHTTSATRTCRPTHSQQNMARTRPPDRSRSQRNRQTLHISFFRNFNLKWNFSNIIY